MWGSIKYNLSHLLDFTGRDARQTFWFWVLFVFLLNMAVGIAIVIPFMGQMMAGMMQAAGTGDQAAVAAQMGAGMGEMMETTLWIGVGTTVLNALLLAAAFTRRLHDSNLSGWWGLIPLGMQAAATWYSTTRIDEIKALTGKMMDFSDPQAAMAAQNQMSSLSMLGWVAIIALVALGVRKSTDGPNRYAERPVSF